MKPVCEVPGCPQEANGRLALYAEHMGGSLSIPLCALHMAFIINGLPSIIEAMKPVK